MTTDAIRQYLGFLMSAFSERTTKAEIHETEEEPVLYLGVVSPFDPDGEIAYEISLQPVDESFVAAETVVYLFDDIGREKFDELNILINRINQYISFGSFRLYEDNGSVMFCHGMILEDTMQTASVNELVVKTIGAMEDTFADLGGYIRRALDGESTQALIKELQEAMTGE